MVYQCQKIKINKKHYLKEINHLKIKFLEIRIQVNQKLGDYMFNYILSLDIIMIFLLLKNFITIIQVNKLLKNFILFF